jgi:uncharacterized protein YtpQ (UPF0354 family)
MSIFKNIFSKDKASDNQNQSGQIDVDKIYPRIKGLWVDNANPLQTEKTITLSDADFPLYKELADDIGLFFVTDKGDYFDFIQNKHINQDDLTFDKIKHHALQNLDATALDKTQINGDINEIAMITNGGNYEAVIILLDTFWQGLKNVIKDEICFAIPANDVLFISPKSSISGRQKMKQLINQYFDDPNSRGLITKNIYEQQDGKFVCIDKA